MRSKDNELIQDVKRSKTCKTCKHRMSMENFFPSDGVWLVSEKGSSGRCLGPLPSPLEVAVLASFQYHRIALCKAVQRILELYTTKGISNDVGASIIIEEVMKEKLDETH